MSLDLRVGPIRARTLMHVMDDDTLGIPWLKVHKAAAFTYHQFVKAI